MLICKSCGKNVGSFDNQGTKDNPVCFDCANKNTVCCKCGMAVSISDYVSDDGKKYCRSCFDQHSKEKREISSPKTAETAPGIVEVRRFTRSEKSQKMIVLGCVFGAVGLALAVFRHSFTMPLWGLGLLLSLAMLVSKNRPVLTFFDSCLKFRLAWIMPERVLRYEDILDVRSEGMKLVVSSSGRVKELRIRMGLFDEEYHNEIEKLLRNIAATKTLEPSRRMQHESSDDVIEITVSSDIQEPIQV
jgi:hypothetical protein